MCFFVETANARGVLALLETGKESAFPILLEGPSASGKNTLVRELYRRFKEETVVELVTVCLGDQVDGKEIVGSYAVSSTMAGGFEWQPGAVIKAMRAGSWLLLTDLHLASMEVLSVLRPLFGRNPRMYVPGLGMEVEAASSFRIFGTLSNGVPCPFDTICRPLWYVVPVPEPSWLDMQEVLLTRHPHVSRFVPWLQRCSAWDLRALLKVGARLNYPKKALDAADQAAFLQAMFDVLFASKRDPVASIQSLARDISLAEDVAMELCFGQVAVNGNKFGRAQFDRVPKVALTRVAAQILERIAVATQLGENVLLVGETGTGKTTLVQELQRLMGGADRLAIVNMSQQTEAGDLLGGWRPMSVTALAKQLYAHVDRVLFTDLRVSRAKNAEWTASVQGAFVDKQWPRFATLLRSSLPLVRRAEAAHALLEAEIVAFEIALKQPVSFRLQEGILAQARRLGHWLLLDELNLATPETLNILTATARDEHHDNGFRIFACMNPATDVSKRNLPESVRVLFTELFVPEADGRREDMIAFMAQWQLGDVQRIADFYYAVKEDTSLVDGNGKRPLLNLRAVSRALRYAQQTERLFRGWQRAVFEGFSMTVGSVLDEASRGRFQQHAQDSLRSFSNAVVAYALADGPLPKRTTPLVFTPSVRSNLAMLSRAVHFGQCPVLLEGPTSAGKTSLVEHLAAVTGHAFVRINNHEHTDVQEYLGTYASVDGTLQFRDGPLVQAMRLGHWLLLDELNLAPSDVLEALNRVLDDNREVYVPDTDEVVKAHPGFLLFATQNPAGSVYGGRKQLSRAFRSRFLEIHVGDIPLGEVEQIVGERCRDRIAPSQAKRICAVYQQLQENRRGMGNVLAGRHALITLRDLFRWVMRAADSNEDIARNGYEVLAERLRTPQDAALIKQVIEDVFRCAIDVSNDAVVPRGNTRLVWTGSMKRLFRLISTCLANGEAVLLVGETGCGKTSVCQAVAEAARRHLTIVNCHQNSEAADLIGSFRPNRAQTGELFSWVDGPLVGAMRRGDLLLIDEISLADDSVLERLNSVLETSRTLTLAEKGATETVTAAPGFGLLATMNPGGDYGKKELSPALRNRFTEIWVPPVLDAEDIRLIVEERVPQATKAIVDFWLHWTVDCRQPASVRDVVALAEFIEHTSEMDWRQSFVHGACLVFLDRQMSQQADGRVFDKLLEIAGVARASLGDRLLSEPSRFGVEPFTMPRSAMVEDTFSFRPATTRLCLVRILRALQIPKRAILIEGSPGIGKTALVAALAKQLGQPLSRINLSEQTDLSDLFGSDLPVSVDGKLVFQWVDGPFLKALKEGHWIVLDELNLASQSVLEGLNACLDHRSTVYIPELDRHFDVDARTTRIFGTQNPQREGGGRKGLPRSFLNRFSTVWMDPLNGDDYRTILEDTTNVGNVGQLVAFVEAMRGAFPAIELSMRDLMRWVALGGTSAAVPMLFGMRFARDSDRATVYSLAEQILGERVTETVPYGYIGNSLQVGRHANLRPVPLLPGQIPVVDAMLTCVECNWLVVLSGPSGSGKTHLLRQLAAMHDVSLVEFAMNEEVDTGELLGAYEQGNRQRNICRAVEDMPGLANKDAALQWLNRERSAAELDAFCQTLSVEVACAPFEWVDGPLVRAMLLGQWLVLDNASLCSPSVLDRLNGMFEDGGVLSLPEQGCLRGSIRTVRPHPRFRVFLTINPELHGEVSRAMRNRAVQLCMRLPTPLDAWSFLPRQGPDSWHGLVKVAAGLPVAAHNVECTPNELFWMQAGGLLRIRYDMPQHLLQALISHVQVRCAPHASPYAGLALAMLSEIVPPPHFKLVEGALLASVASKFELNDAMDALRRSLKIDRVDASTVELVFSLPLLRNPRQLDVDVSFVEFWQRNCAKYAFKTQDAAAAFFALIDGCINSCWCCKENATTIRDVAGQILQTSSPLILSFTRNCTISRWCNECVVFSALQRVARTLGLTCEFGAFEAFSAVTGSARFFRDSNFDFFEAAQEAMQRRFVLGESHLREAFRQQLLQLLRAKSVLPGTPIVADPKALIRAFAAVTMDPVDHFHRRHLAQEAFRAFDAAHARAQQLLAFAYYGAEPSCSTPVQFEDASPWLRGRDDQFEHLRHLLRRVVAHLDDPDGLRLLRPSLCSLTLWLDFTTPVLDAIDSMLDVDRADEEPRLTLTKKPPKPKSIDGFIFSMAYAALVEQPAQPWRALVEELYRVKPEPPEARTFYYRGAEEESARDADMESELFGSQETVCKKPEDAEQIAFDVLHGSIERALDAGSRVLRCRQSMQWQLTRKECAQNPYENAASPTQQADLQAVLHRLQGRLSTLSAEFPEHDVLEQLQKQLDRLALLPSDATPLMAICTSLEHFLQKSQDWHTVADKAHSLDVSPVVQLVIKARRQEVTAWRQLFSTLQERSRQAAMLHLTFVARLSLRTDAIDDLVDAFLLGSPLGEFETRLELVRMSFGQDNHIYRYHRLLLPVLSAYMTSQRGPLEADLQAHLVTISWNDQTLWALRESARRSHRIIARACRRFREEILGLSVSLVLGKVPTPPRIPVFDASTYLGRLQTMIGERVAELQTVDDMAAKEKAFVDLVRTCKQLGIRPNAANKPTRSLDVVKKASDDAALHNIRTQAVVMPLLERCQVMTPRQVQAMVGLLRDLQQLCLFAIPDDCVLSQGPLLRVKDWQRVNVEIRRQLVRIQEEKLFAQRLSLPVENIQLPEELPGEIVDEQRWLAVGVKSTRVKRIRQLPLIEGDLKTRLETCLLFTLSTDDEAPRMLLSKLDLISRLPRFDKNELLPYRQEPLVRSAVTHLNGLYAEARQFRSDLIDLHSRLLLVFRALAEHGFCRPEPQQQQQQQQAEEIDDGKMESGMGMDDSGSGDKNVSNEMEFEEQLGQEKQDGGKEKQEPKEEQEETLDLRQDFDAQLEDLLGSEPEQPEDVDPAANDSKEPQTGEEERQAKEEEPEELKDQMGKNDSMEDIQAMDQDIPQEEEIDDNVNANESVSLSDGSQFDNDATGAIDGEVTGSDEESYNCDDNDEHAGNLEEPEDENMAEEEAIHEEQETWSQTTEENPEENEEEHRQKRDEIGTQEEQQLTDDQVGGAGEIREERDEGGQGRSSGGQEPKREQQQATAQTMADQMQDWYRGSLTTEQPEPASQLPRNAFARDQEGTVGVLADGSCEGISEPKDILPGQDEQQSMDDRLETLSACDGASKRRRLEQEEDAEELATKDAEMDKVAVPAFEQADERVAAELAEQLRLILSPTVASRLKGDYRTGRRLNMRRILPYIASQYRRDRIWLRRTKPSKRDYRVCLAIDNSRSMANAPETASLAVQAMQLVARAMAKLEVGSVELVSFGKEVATLPLDNVLLDRLLSFEDQSTDMPALLSHFSSLKAGSLCIVISDGICDEHEALRRQQTDLLACSITPIFVVVDTKPPGQSITELSRVEQGPEGGIVVRKYLPTFPFDYYVIVRELERLPEILLGVLKQWLDHNRDLS